MCALGARHFVVCRRNQAWLYEYDPSFRSDPIAIGHHKYIDQISALKVGKNLIAALCGKRIVVLHLDGAHAVNYKSLPYSAKHVWSREMSSLLSIFSQRWTTLATKLYASIYPLAFLSLDRAWD